jgi:hypothetical protein
VERSADGVNYSFIGIVPAKTNPAEKNNYSYQDENPKSGTNYYRLIQEDIDGKTEVFDAKKIIIHDSRELSMGIISATDQKLMIRINSGEETNIVASILTQDGKTVVRKKYFNLKGSVNEQFTLIPGVYYCEIRNDKGRKIVKQISMH